MHGPSDGQSACAQDHPHEAVTLDTQLNACFPQLADPKATFGFRHVHQLDFATSGVLCVGLNKKAAAAASQLFEKRAPRPPYRCMLTRVGRLASSLSMAISPSAAIRHPPCRRHGL